MPLPGGINGLARLLRVEAAPERSHVFLDVIRRLYNQSLDAGQPDDRRDLEGYFAALASLQTALAPFAQSGVSLKLITGADKRADGERLLHALGLRLPAAAGGNGAPPLALDDDRAAVARRGYLAAAGIDPEAIARALGAGDAVPIAVARDEVP